MYRKSHNEIEAPKWHSICVKNQCNVCRNRCKINCKILLFEGAFKRNSSKFMSSWTCMNNQLCWNLLFYLNNWIASTWTDLWKTSWEYSSNGNCNERRCSSFWTFLNSIMWYQFKTSSIQLYLSFDWFASGCLNHFHSVTFNLNEIVPLFEYIRQHSESLSTFFWFNNIFHSL